MGLFNKLKSPKPPNKIYKKVLIPLDIKNKNGRIYTKKNLETHVQEFIDRKNTLMVIYGEFDHPDIFDTSLSRISHTIENIWFEGNKLMGEVRILNTHYGKELQSLIDEDIEVVFRPRSAGSVDSMGYVHLKKLFTFDAITIDKDAFYSIQEARKMKLNRLIKKQEEQGMLYEARDEEYSYYSNQQIRKMKLDELKEKNEDFNISKNNLLLND